MTARIRRSPYGTPVLLLQSPHDLTVTHGG
jgi:hypothetical protein